MGVQEGSSAPEKRTLLPNNEQGHRWGDLFMSLIHTCGLNGANPFDYMTELQRHAKELYNNPTAWMPWNYRESLAKVQSPPPDS